MVRDVGRGGRNNGRRGPRDWLIAATKSQKGQTKTCIDRPQVAKPSTKACKEK